MADNKIDILKKIRIAENGYIKKMNLLYEYYIGKHPILKTAKPDGKPNNRLVVNYAKNIVNNTTGYYLGIPVKYRSDDDNLQADINSITEYNDDAFQNIQLGKDLSIFGRAAELLYIDSDNQIRYAKINPMHLYVGYSNDVEQNIEYALRWYDVRDDYETTVRYIEAYYPDRIEYYTAAYGGNPQQTDEKEHYFGEVPINVYKNNEDCRGDYDDCTSLFDAYNVMQSESVNDFQKFADAILAVKNTIVDDKTAENMRDKNILELMDDGNAEWLVKSVNDGYVENIKNRLEKDIYMTSSTVNMSDDNFANNASGVAIRYKLMCMENRISITERFFKKALQRRIELICNILNLKGHNYKYTDVDINFIRNIPANMQETATLIQQLNGNVSRETLLAQIPFVTDVSEEIKRMDEQRHKEYPDIFNPLNGDDLDE